MANQIPLAIADVELQLASAISIGSTSFTLSSATDDDGVALPAGKYVFTIDNGSSTKEYLIGQLNGTSVTSVMSVSRQGVETSGAARVHRVGASVILTDFATIQRVADVLRGQIALDSGAPLYYDATPTLTDGAQLATVAYVLSVVAGGTVSFDAQVATNVNGGESIVSGNLVYLNAADQEWYLTDADTAATVEGVTLGIAKGTGSNGASITGGVHLGGIYTTTGLTAGALYYASNTAGGISTSAGTIKRIIGIALSTTRLLFFPTHHQSPTTREKDAMAGAGGTPSTSNRFLTEESPKAGIKSMTAGATINGATTPVPVYQSKSDFEFYACDANDSNALKFLGFATSNGTDGNALIVQFDGIVGGFTGLTRGEKYYVQDTAGTIGTAIGTNEILVGLAISTTEILIMRGTRRAAGEGGSLGTTDGSLPVTTGFRPSVIRIFATCTSNSHSSALTAVYANGAIRGVATHYNEGSSAAGENSARLYSDSTGSYMTLSISAISDTGFTVSWTEFGTFTGNSAFVWEAEGEL